MTARIKHIVEGPTKKQDDLTYIRWKIFVDAEPDVLEKIRMVEYTLHPTFREPIVTKKNRDEKFLLMSNGWSDFNIRVKIFLEGNRELEKTYPLTVNKSNESGLLVDLTEASS